MPITYNITLTYAYIILTYAYIILTYAYNIRPKDIKLAKFLNTSKASRFSWISTILNKIGTLQSRPENFTNAGLGLPNLATTSRVSNTIRRTRTTIFGTAHMRGNPNINMRNSMSDAQLEEVIQRTLLQTPEPSGTPMTSLVLTANKPIQIPPNMKSISGNPSASEKLISEWCGKMLTAYDLQYNIRPFDSYSGRKLEADISIARNGYLVAEVEVNGEAHYTSSPQIFRDAIKISQIANAGALYIPIDVRSIKGDEDRIKLYKDLVDALTRCNLEFIKLDMIGNIILDDSLVV